MNDYQLSTSLTHILHGLVDGLFFYAPGSEFCQILSTLDCMDCLSQVAYVPRGHTSHGNSAILGHVH